MKVNDFYKTLKGHFHLDVLDKNDKVLDTFDEHNMIMADARKSMAEIFAYKSFCAGYKNVFHYFVPFASSSWMYFKEAIFALVSSTVSKAVLLESNSVSLLRSTLP